MSLVSLLIALVVICVLVWACRALLSAFSIGDPIATLVQVILVFIVIVYLLGQFGVVGGVPRGWPLR